MKKNLLICALTLGLAFSLKAQQDISLQTLNNVFQQSYVNPAYLPQSNFHIGLPGSSIYTRVSNTGFAFGEVLSKNGSNSVDINKLVDGLGKRNLTAVDAAVDLFSIGVKVKSFYVSLSATQHISTNLVFPKDFALLFTRGNADPSVIGRPLDLNDLAFNLNVYQQFAASIAFPLGDKLRLGVRGKYLAGLVNTFTDKSELTLTTNEDNYNLRINGSLGLKTSGLNEFQKAADGDLVQYFQDKLTKPGSSNSGFGVDLGLEYAFSEKLTFGASVIDLGYIKWNNDIDTYSNDNINYEFSGLDARKLSPDLISTELNNQLDTLKARFNLQKGSGGAYTNRLNTQVIGSFNLKVGGYNSVGGIARLELISKILRPSLTAYYQFKINNIFAATVNYSYLNKSLVNIGGGLVAKLFPLQFYVASDNILAPFALNTAKGFQLRTGINLVFGGKDLRKIKVPEYEGLD